YRADEAGNQWTGVSAKVAGLERQVRELAARTPAAPDRKRTEEIDARLTRLEAAAAAPTAPSQAQKADAQTAANPAERSDLAALAQNLSKLAPAMLEAASAPRREAGVMERLQASAERLVRIRPVEEASGDEPSTMVARAELKATRGDIAGALADLERLPEPV